MKHVGRFVGAVALGILLSAVVVPGQHVFSATYDDGRQIRLQGSVTRIEWVNPRAYFFIDVRDAAGTITNWAVEFGNPLDLERDGWKRSSLRIGDVVTVAGGSSQSRRLDGHPYGRRRRLAGPMVASVLDRQLARQDIGERQPSPRSWRPAPRSRCPTMVS
jgi:hypothetical protein